MSPAMLLMRGLRARRGPLSLGPIDLEVRTGEVVALAGPNGAGKSSVLALATGEIASSSGSCALAGEDPRSLPRAEVARRAALVRQGGAPRLPSSVLDLVLHGRWLHLSGLRFPGPADERLASDALARCGAAELARRDVRSLSGGEMQRVLLARALSQASPLLLLDEPTSNLDLAHRARVLRLVRELADEDGKGCLLVSHDLDLVAAACDRVVLLREGRVEASGAPGDALEPAALERTYGLPVVVERTSGGRLHVTPDWPAGGGQERGVPPR